MPSPRNSLRLPSASSKYRCRIGAAGERWCVDHLECPQCGCDPNWTNLNTIERCYPGVDIVCNACSAIIQVKTSATALTWTSRGWTIPVSPVTTRAYIETGRMRIVYIHYERATGSIESVTITGRIRLSQLDPYTGGRVYAKSVKSLELL